MFKNLDWKRIWENSLIGITCSVPALVLIVIITIISLESGYSVKNIMRVDRLERNVRELGIQNAKMYGEYNNHRHIGIYGKIKE